jgi:alpha-ketoglutarate-dependent taurine dioxygenase
VMWDNCTVQHKAILDYDLPQRRLLHRLTIAGTVPMQDPRGRYRRR